MLLTQAVKIKLRNSKKDILTKLRRLSKNISNLMSNIKEIPILPKQRSKFLDTSNDVSALVARVGQIKNN